MSTPPLILASASPRRAELLTQLGVAFSAVPSSAPESAAEYLSPVELCQLNAYRKARAVAKQMPDRIVLGADTVVCLGTKVYGKPADRGEAERMLLELQGQEHNVLTGVCLLCLRDHRQRLFAVSTAVVFHRLTARQVRDYIAMVDPLDKAGAYAIQEHGERLVERIDGSYSNVVGLPLERLREELTALLAELQRQARRTT